MEEGLTRVQWNQDTKEELQMVSVARLLRNKNKERTHKYILSYVLNLNPNPTIAKKAYKNQGFMYESALWLQSVQFTKTQDV
ncbi:hypothetical protein NDU88_004278 [Pleurodeles waltl]|uniref:Uncharacterized protein n=1 Tax=Pleurodeles waltl TaxID=8319 RepID=A0AAV7RKJ1_PLEWA|nr:hypothetical protein NDU88_004278 [Pleurodeles waltl]